MTGDWLINYNYGFISRGLFGTLLINIFDSQEQLLDALSFVLISIYLLIFLFLNKTFNNNNQNIISYILIFSPASFLFNIYDSQGSFRKEILGILALFILTSLTRERIRIVVIFLSALIYTIGIFSHSVNLFFLTTILYILFKVLYTKKIIHYLFFLIPTALNFIIFFLFSNNEQELYIKRDLMCIELENLDLSNLCGYGAFDFITLDLNAAYYISQNYIINENREASYTYIILFLLSILPLLLDRNTYKNIYAFLFIGISFIPLFLIAIDWGRWIYIISVCFLAIYLISKKNKIDYRYKYILLIYPFLFRVEHCCSPSVQINFYNIITNFDYLKNNLFSSF